MVTRLTNSPTSLLALFGAVLAVCVTAVGQEADEHWFAKASPEAQAAFSQILDKPADYQILSQHRRPIDLTPTEAADGPYLTLDKQGIIITHPAPKVAGYVVDMQIRLVPDKVRGASFMWEHTVDPLPEDKQRLYTSISSTLARNSVSLQAYNQQPDHIGRKLRVYSYTPDGNGARSLAWDGDFRRRIESQSAQAAAVGDTWYDVKLVVTPDRMDLWFHNMMVHSTSHDQSLEGPMTLSMRLNSQLRKLAVTPLPAPSPYQMVRLDAHLNSAELNGQALDRSTLPAANEPTELGGVPFVLPAPNGRGHDHVDVGESWFQEGNQEGNTSGRGHSVGARWRGALYDTPSRLQYRIPNKRYRAIHLIAATDSDADSIPAVTVQFYREQAGFPTQVEGRVPAFTATASDAVALDVKQADGSPGRLYLVTIPINPGDLAGFDDQDHLELELTKQTRLYRASPDPFYYSTHAGGLPSAVHVYAMTLEAPMVDMDVQAATYGHIWTAPATPSYTVTFTNTTDAPRTVSLAAGTESWDGSEKTAPAATTYTIPAGDSVSTTLNLPLERFGLHHVTFTARDGDQVWEETVNLAHLRPDDRERGDWAPEKGPFFGYWAWNGGHNTPGNAKEAQVMAWAGADGRSGTYESADDEEKAIARQYKMVTLKHFSGADHYATGGLASNLSKMPREEALKTMIDRLREIETKPSDITQLRYVSFFPEPHLGMVSTGHLTDYLGRPAPVLDEAAQARAESFAEAVRHGVPAIKAEWPQAQPMMPHGDPVFYALMMRHAPDIRDLVEGIAIDIPCFERPPEAQLHQVVIHRFWSVSEEIKRIGKDGELQYPMYEGPCIPDQPGAVEPDLAAGYVIRNSLILISYGINQFTGSFGAFHAGNYWGEQHYGGGLMHRVPLAYPKSMYTAYATMTRHLNRRPYAGWVPTGSLSTYMTAHDHYQTGERVHAAWTIHGTRPMTATVPDGTTVAVYDMQDNVTTYTAANGTVTFPIDRLPRFIHGLPKDTAITLGEPDHSDAAPGEHARKIASLGDGSWTITRETNDTYAFNHPDHIFREPGVMTGAIVPGQTTDAGPGLAVTLADEQAMENHAMPYYAVIKPAAPVELPGKGHKIGMWVRASSDWGRVVYQLVDAKGERWISVGTKEQWNCDDVHSWSYFSFDGWRYVTFELPAHAGWDSYREAGTVWWGHHDGATAVGSDATAVGSDATAVGDGIVDLPLKLDQVIIERRTHAMYVNSPQETSTDAVVLGDVYVEYADPADATDEAVRISRLRWPLPTGEIQLDNPIAEMATENTLPAIPITEISLPPQHADGTRCHVHFDAVEDADLYEVWGSAYPDGRGAVLLNGRLTESGGLVRGLRPDTDFWLFLVYKKKDGRTYIGSKPSDGVKINLKDVFGNK